LEDLEIETTMPSLYEAVDNDNYPQPFPALIRVINLYGKTINLLRNNTITKHSAEIAKELVQLSPKLVFSVPNFQYYDKAHQSSAFVLHHFWFHALTLLLNEPTDCMSSAKAIVEIVQLLVAMELTIKLSDNPYTSYPIHIAACALLQEAVSCATWDPSYRSYLKPYTQPAVYCYNALKVIEQYWNGVSKYTTALCLKIKAMDYQSKVCYADDLQVVSKPAANWLKAIGMSTSG
jgi:hypothetical protein